MDASDVNIPARLPHCGGICGGEGGVRGAHESSIATHRASEANQENSSVAIPLEVYPQLSMV